MEEHTSDTEDTSSVLLGTSNVTPEVDTNSEAFTIREDFNDIPCLRVRHRSRSAITTHPQQRISRPGEDLYTKVLHQIYDQASPSSCDACSQASPVNDKSIDVSSHTSSGADETEAEQTHRTCMSRIRSLQRHILARKRYKALLVTLIMIFLLSYTTYQNKHHILSLHSLTSIFNRDSPGLTLQEWGVEAHHPIVLVPGIISSGLELWETLPCAAGKFRSRVWGSASMVQSLLSDPSCWMQHMALNGTTGGDPTGVRVRAAQVSVDLDTCMLITSFLHHL